MADEKKNPLGPVGEQVRANVERLREARGLTKKELADRTRELGRPVPPLGVSRIEAGTRRVDADDLVALADALNVSPNDLLLPPNASDEPFNLTNGHAIASWTAWQWALGQRPAMDWEPGEGVNLAAPGASPFIPIEAVEREEEFGRLRTEYLQLALPEELRRAADHPAVRLARQLEELVKDIVAPEPDIDRAGLKARERMARRRLQQLGIELDEIAEQLEITEQRRVAHPGLAPDDPKAQAWEQARELFQDGQPTAGESE